MLAKTILIELTAIVGIALLCWPTQSFADTDIAQILNDALAKKPLINRTRQTDTLVRTCAWSGDVGPHSEWCTYEHQIGTQPFQDHARVTTPLVISTSALLFDKAKATTLPEQVLQQTGHFSNCAPPIFNGAVNLSVTGTQSSSVTKSHSLTSTRTLSLSGELSVGIFSTSLGVSQSISLSDSTSKSEQTSSAITRSYSGSVTLKNGEATDIDLIAYQTTADIPFSAQVVVDGDLEANDSGYTKASQLLSVSERTLPFDGVVRLAGVSEGIVRQRPQAVKIDCSAPLMVNRIQGSQSTGVYDAKGMDSKYLKPFASSTTIRTMNRPVLSDEPTIGPPDGIHYEIVSTTEVTRMSPQCGSNDYGVPNGGTYKVETRQYEQWSGGKLVGQWTDTVETFESCSAAP